MNTALKVSQWSSPTTVWNSLGPNPDFHGGVGEGGVVTCIAYSWDIAPSSDPLHNTKPALFLGTNGGVWRSEDFRSDNQTSKAPSLMRICQG
jgi:hypothetical protein